MDIHDYFKVKNYLEGYREMLRETILHDVLINPEKYDSSIVDGLNRSGTINIRPEFDEDDTPFVVEMVGNLWSEVFAIPDDLIRDVQMSWGKEREIEEVVNLFETRSIGTVYGLASRREILTPREQEKYFSETSSGRRVFIELELDCDVVTPQGVRFSMRHFDPRSTRKFSFYVDSDLLTFTEDLTNWQYWDEISRP